LLLRVRHHRPEFANWKGYIVYAVAPALGFSTVENVGYTVEAAGQGVGQGVLAAVMRVLVATPLHCLTGYLLGIGFARREVFGEPLKWYHIMAVPVFVHGFFDFFQFVLAAFEVQLNAIQ
jgi:RsiW-degrading membrane proteinase PrsW (M82 family)